MRTLRISWKRCSSRKAEPPSARAWFCYAPCGEAARQSKGMVEKITNLIRRLANHKDRFLQQEAPLGNQIQNSCYHTGPMASPNSKSSASSNH